MNKETYLRILRGHLHVRLSKAEVDDIMDYYTEYFADAGADREQKVIEELGSPERLAQQILGERGREELSPVPVTPGADVSGRPRESGGRLPVWAGVLIVVVAAVFAGPAVASTAFGLGLGGVICIAVGLGVAVAAIGTLSPAGVLFQMGGGLIAAAVGVLLLLSAVLIVWLTVKLARWFWGCCVEGGAGHEAAY